MGSIRLESLSDYAKRGYKVRLDCECGRVVVIDPLALLQIAHGKGIGHHLDKIGQRLKCSTCGKPPVRIGPAFGLT